MKSVKTIWVAALTVAALGTGQAQACEGSAKVQATAQTEQKVCPFTGKTAQTSAQTDNVRFVTVSQQSEGVQSKQCSQSCNTSSVVSAMALAFALVGGMALGVRKIKI